MKSVAQLPNRLSDEEARIAEFERRLPVLERYIRAHAKMRAMEYRALIAEGFTPQEAIQLVRQRTGE